MSKLSEPVAKAFNTLLERCKGDTTVVMRTIIGNYSATEYFINLKDEIGLLRCAPFNDILIALVEGLPQAIKTTEQPSKAEAVEGILTEEELKERNRLLVLENDEQTAQIEKFKNGMVEIYCRTLGLNFSASSYAKNILEECGYDTSELPIE